MNGILALKESSNIKAAHYNSDTQTLTVIFQSGGVYTYNEVPMCVVSAWVLLSNDTKGSTGSIFNILVKKAGFKCDKIGTI